MATSQGGMKKNFDNIGTRKQIRTATPFQAPPPQGGASTNFATRVYIANINL